MTEVMHGLLAEAKKNKYSTIRETLSEDDISAVWENVSNFIEKQMGQQKGVNIPGLGTFTFTQKKLDIGNNKFILIQRPVFNISEKLAQSQALQYTKYHVPGQIPVVQLNYAALSFESPFDRDSVESCVREILGAVTRAVGARKNVELTFTGIGRLSIRESKVKMKFYKEFINQMDGSGKLADALQNRPGTVDSVISDRAPSRAHSANTVVLPKISSGNGQAGLAPVVELDENELNKDLHQDVVADELDRPVAHVPIEDIGFPMPANTNVLDISPTEGIEGFENDDVGTAAAIRHIEDTGEPYELGLATPGRNVTLDAEGRPDQKRIPMPPSRTGSRMAVPMAQATGVSLLDDLVPSVHTPKSAPSPGFQAPRTSPGPLRELTDNLPKPHPPTSPKLAPLERPASTGQMMGGDVYGAEGLDQLKPGEKVLTPPGSACGHANAGQELCYLCHQRQRRNIPVSFKEEIKKRQEEEDRLLQQYQYMKDAENVLSEQENLMAKRHDLQKMAAFNLGVAEAVHNKKRSRDTEFHKSYVFQRRPLTPPRFPKQVEYSKDLAKQVEVKEMEKNKIRSDEEFLERLEQVQLAEDLAIQREQYLQDKAEGQDRYKQALEAQMRANIVYAMFDELRQPSRRVRLPHLTKVRPFSDPKPESRLNEDLTTFGRLRFKPLQVPPREPDYEVFGKHDMTNEKMAERRRRAYELFREQQDNVGQRKREAILKRLQEQREEEDVLERNKLDMMEDRANRFKRRLEARKRLETDWMRASKVKQDREMEDRIRALSPGLLLHEQCDKYSRCAQCKRLLKNVGESNIWRETRYIPGSRLMV